MEELHREWAQTIYEERKARGWTQRQLAELIGVRTSTISRWESRDPDPSHRLVPSDRHKLALARAFGKPVRQLFPLVGGVE